MPTLSRRRLLYSSLALAGGAALAGCGGGGTSPGGKGGSNALATATTDNLSSVDPALAFDTWSTSVVHACTRRLVDYDAEGKLVGDLAEEWKEAEGGKSITFRLRAGQKFADGTVITSAHFKTALNRLKDPATASPGASFYAGIQAVETSDPMLLTLRLKAPDPTFLHLMGLTFAAPWKDGDDPRHPTSSGPYLIKEHVPDSRIALARNPEYSGSAAAVEAIALQLNLAQPLQWTRFQSGDLDLLPSLPPSEYDRVMADPAEKARVVQGVVNQTWYFGMNLTRAPWSNPKVRQAALRAINREKLAGIGGPGELANGILPPHVPGYSPDRKLPTYDPEAAKALLAESGIGTVPKTVMWLANNEQYQRRAELIQSDLAAVGIPIELRAVVFSEYRSGYRTKADCWYGGWYPDFPDAGNFLEPVLHSTNIGEDKSNAARYKNPEFDVLLDRAHGTPLGPVRESLYRQAEDLLVQDLPWIPLTFEVETRYFRPGVSGVVVHPVWRQMLTGISKA